MFEKLFLREKGIVGRWRGLGDFNIFLLCLLHLGADMSRLSFCLEILHKIF